MRIMWLEDAVHDLQSLRDYISQDDPSAATEQVQKILYLIDILAFQPGMGRKGRVLHTRELIISGTPYILAYRVKKEALEILRVLHTARQWPNDFN